MRLERRVMMVGVGVGGVSSHTHVTPPCSPYALFGGFVALHSSGARSYQGNW